MKSDLLSVEIQLKAETSGYLINGIKWVSVISIYLLVAIFLNVAFNGAAKITPSQLFASSIPLFVVLVFGLYLGFRAADKYRNNFVVVLYVGLLTLSWLILATSVLILAPQSVKSIASVNDILILAYMVAFFPYQRLTLFTIAGFVGFNCITNILLGIEHYLFQLTTLISYLAIAYTGQRVLHSWFKKAVLRDIEKQKLIKQFRRMALIDSLTSLSNRRHFDEIFLQEIRASERNQRPLSIILVDIDYFKLLNDSVGHQAGDEALIAVANVLESVATRPRDLCARFGGEEFVILLPETDIRGATEIAGRLQKLLAEAKITHPNSPLGPYVTVSQGVCQWLPLMNAETMLAKVDELLYQAKRQGRNCFKQAF